jgi:hypothetical protein
MPELTAKRTLVKSPPELWEELSEVERLAKHLGAFGEIKISKLEPEHTVAWEGEHASGTVSIEPSGWGTKVTLTAELAEITGEPEIEAPAEPEHAPEPEPLPAQPASRWRVFWTRFFSGWRVPDERLRPVAPHQPPPAHVEVAPAEPTGPPALDGEPPSEIDRGHAESVLNETLDALGSAHHRPFSRP